MDFELVDSIRRFVREEAWHRRPGRESRRTPAGPDRKNREDRFRELAWRAFAFQVEHVGPVRALARAREIEPEPVGPAASSERPPPDWRTIPPVPALAYKSLDLLPEGLDPAGAIPFRSSGTTGGTERRSLHRHPLPDLYRETIEATFPAACLPSERSGPAGDQRSGTGPRVPMLSLIPARADVPDSSLSFMVDHAVHRWGSAGSAYVLGPDGLDAGAAAAWVRDRQRSGPETPCLVLATAFALAGWLDRLEEAGTRLALPRGSVVFETGGFKGRTRSLSRAALRERVRTFLGVPAGRIVREYGMTELTSQLYTRALSGGDPDLLVPPPWVRVRVLDPETLEEARPGETGLIAVLDLANLGSAIHVLTEDLGTVEDGGLRLKGRARGAELRGCSLTAEELENN